MKTQEQDPKPPVSSKLPVREKIAYGIGSANDVWGNWLFPAMIWTVFNIHLKIDPAIIGLILLVNRLVDAVSDPVFGWLSDNTRSRFGRRRPYIMVGSIFSGLCFMGMFWFIQDDWGNSENWYDNTYFWYLTFASGVLITAVSCFNMPYQSLGAELTPDYNERTSVFAFRGALQKIFEIATFGAAAFVTLECWNGDILWGAKIYAIIIGFLMMIVGLITFLGVKEHYYEKVVKSKQEATGIIETLTGALKCPPFRAQLAMALSYGIGTSMLGTLGYYITIYYVLQGNVADGAQWTLGMGFAGTVLGFAGIPIFASIAQKYGKRKGMMAVQIISIVVFAVCWFLYNPENPWLQLLAAGLIAFTSAAFWMLYGALGADVIDYDELETGKRREGAFSACGSYLMKIGLAIGAFGGGLVLKWTGFDAELGAAQAPETLTNMRIAFSVIPITSLIVAFLFLLSFGLTPKKSAEIREALEKRRGTIK